MTTTAQDRTYNATWTRHLTPGWGRTFARPTRVSVRSEPVTVLGPVAFEPSMLRVRRADGTVVRAMRGDLS